MSTIRLSKIKLEAAPAAKEAAVPVTYELTAPLDADGQIDLAGWKEKRALCFVHRREKDGPLQHGLLVHRPGGTGGSTWVFDYEPGQGDEESGFRFDAHRFKAGAYVAIRDVEGETHTYRVTSVTPA